MSKGDAEHVLADMSAVTVATCLLLHPSWLIDDYTFVPARNKCELTNALGKPDCLAC